MKHGSSYSPPPSGGYRDFLPDLVVVLGGAVVFPPLRPLPLLTLLLKILRPTLWLLVDHHSPSNQSHNWNIRLPLFRRLPKLNRRHPNISEDHRRSPKISEHHPKASEDVQRSPEDYQKSSEAFRKLPKLDRTLPKIIEDQLRFFLIIVKVAW